MNNTTSTIDSDEQHPSPKPAHHVATAMGIAYVLPA
jgi:hypothetical protein